MTKLEGIILCHKYIHGRCRRVTQHVVVMEPRKEVVSTTMQYAPKVGNVCGADTEQNFS